jgi:hypothetical protein
VPGSQVVRQRILIPPYAGSTPARATTRWLTLFHRLLYRDARLILSPSRVGLLQCELPLNHILFKEPL